MYISGDGAHWTPFITLFTEEVTPGTRSKVEEGQTLWKALVFIFSFHSVEKTQTLIILWRSLLNGKSIVWYNKKHCYMYHDGSYSYRKLYLLKKFYEY